MWFNVPSNEKNKFRLQTPTKNDFCQLGDKIDCAGYMLFGPSTQLVYHAGFRVNVYNLDIAKKQFNLTFNNVKAPKKRGIVCLDTSRLDMYNKNVRLWHQRRFE